ncbi:MAG: amino acid permease, partial [Metallibacterium sp.]
MRWSQALTRHKSIAQLQQEAGARRDLRRVLGIWQLTAIGIGGIIGVGIFVLAGQQAAVNAGPAVFISFLIAGVASAAAALCYAEFAGLIPVTGSAYTYGYAVLGEFAAWVIGWDLLLEYALIVAVVAIGWSGYMQALLSAASLHLPRWAQGNLSSDTLAYYWDRAAMWVGFTLDHPAPRPTGGHVFNVIAAAVSLGIAGLLTIGTEWGARFNTTVVVIKVIGVALVIVAGVYYVNPANWHPFVPPRVVID